MDGILRLVDMIYKRITGRLEHTPRGFAVITDSGERWILEDCVPDSAFVGNDIIAEGVVSGLDRLRAAWIGSPTA